MTMKKLLITMTMLVGVLFGGLMTTAQAENLNYTVSADLPKNQLNSKVSYFDLKVTPGQTQDLTIQIKNSDNAAHKYVVTPNRATTNDNGVIDYSQSKAKADASLKFDINRPCQSHKQSKCLPRRRRPLLLN